MKLWTIHPVEVHERLLDAGRLTVSWKFADPDRVEAYRWMAEQMEVRGIALHGNAPVWAWRVWGTRERPRPDLRASNHLHSGTRGVRMEIDAPDDLVLLSEFTDWHAVLNRGYLSWSEAEAEEVDARGCTDEEMRRSWGRIFDLAGGDPEWNGPVTERMIQACLPYLDAEWVRRTDPFTAR